MATHPRNVWENENCEVIVERLLVMFAKWGKKKGEEGTTLHHHLEKFNGSVLFGQFEGLLTLKKPHKNGQKIRRSKTKTNHSKNHLQMGSLNM